jgi:hypothetical protein
VLCPSRPLWTAIAGEPDDGRQLCALAELRPWQTELLADPLWDAYRRVMAEAVTTPAPSASEPGSTAG